MAVTVAGQLTPQPLPVAHSPAPQPLRVRIQYAAPLGLSGSAKHTVLTVPASKYETVNLLAALHWHVSW